MTVTAADVLACFEALYRPEDERRYKNLQKMTVQAHKDIDSAKDRGDDVAAAKARARLANVEAEMATIRKRAKEGPNA